ncbi:glycoside hydrolase superfamily [Tribonema minus]|uniref:Glycoside hydrolase superfamily n=1 Tax=Tribonema minus TaxID=303371 RepID=A0A835ZM96_9STRA|nr:glycoside hydrolase superfamily [Tribonema minus]
MAKTATQILSEIGIGLNLGQVFESKQNSRRPDQVRPWLAAVKAKGFGHVRIPVTWYPSDACVLDDSEFVHLLDDAIQYAVKIGLTLVINAHHEKWLFDYYDGSDVFNAKFKALWSRIAYKYRAYTQQQLLFEVLNEPDGKFGIGSASTTTGCIELTRTINRVGYEGIRYVDATRIVLVQPNDAGNIWAVPRVYPTKATLPGAGADKSVGIQCHTYDHYNFCLQGGTNAFYKSVDDISADIGKRVAMLMKWHTDIGGQDTVALHLGEFGVGRLDQRQRDADIVRAYYRITSKLFRDKSICCTAWSDNGWFALTTMDASRRVTWPFGLADQILLKS